MMQSTEAIKHAAITKKTNKATTKKTNKATTWNTETQRKKISSEVQGADEWLWKSFLLSFIYEFSIFDPGVITGAITGVIKGVITFSDLQLVGVFGFFLRPGVYR